MARLGKAFLLFFVCCIVFQRDLQLGEERHNKNQSLQREAKKVRKKSQIEPETNPTFLNSKGINHWNKTINGREEL